MKEFEFTFQEGLQVGLRPDKGVSRDKQALADAKNFRIGPSGVEDKPALYQPFDVEYNWPFPSWTKLQRTFLLCYKDLFFVTNSDGSDYTQVEECGETYATTVNWHIADFDKYILAAGNNAVYEIDPIAETGSLADEPWFKTCCNFKGQIFAGNFTSSFKDCDKTYVAWSRIGDISFEPDRKNEAGWAPAGVGEVYKVLPLGGVVMVYGADGVAAFTPQGTPAPTFGKKIISLSGMAARDAASGDGRHHVFLDDSGTLWMINSQLEVQRLGYKEFLSSMIGGDIVISYNPHFGEFYISDGTDTYLLYKGLSKVHEVVHSTVNYHDGQNLSIHQDGSNKNFELTTSILDFGWRGIKRIEALELGVDYSSVTEPDVGDGSITPPLPSSLYTAVDYRRSYVDTWNTSSWRKLNMEGVGFVGVMGTEFRIKVKSDERAYVNLDRIKIRVKLDDKRFVRGTYNVD